MLASHTARGKDDKPIHSQVVLSISNWHFNRDRQYLKFGPRCRLEDVCISLKLSSTAFIAGSVSKEVDGIVDCVESAQVRLFQGGALVATATTDNYGDFKFDRLPPDSGAYVVSISTEGGMKRVEATLTKSVSLGEIRG